VVQRQKGIYSGPLESVSARASYICGACSHDRMTSLHWSNVATKAPLYADYDITACLQWQVIGIFQRHRPIKTPNWTKYPHSKDVALVGPIANQCKEHVWDWAISRREKWTLANLSESAQRMSQCVLLGNFDLKTLRLSKSCHSCTSEQLLPKDTSQVFKNIPTAPYHEKITASVVLVSTTNLILSYYIWNNIYKMPEEYGQ
jgi:hypothetical protein